MLNNSDKVIYPNKNPSGYSLRFFGGSVLACRKGVIKCLHGGHVGGPKQSNDFPLGNILYFYANIFYCFSPPTWPPCTHSIRDLKQRRWRRQRQRRETIDLMSKNNRSARAFYILVHFFAVLCKTTTWNNQILGFLENMSTRRWVFHFLS